VRCSALLGRCSVPFSLVAVATVGAAQTAPLCRLPAATSGAVTRDSAGIQIVENWAPEWQGAAGIRIAEQPRVAIGENATDPDYLFASIAAMTTLSTGAMVVADGQSMELRVYDVAGKFVRRIGRKGQGPGEYRRISSLQRLAGDTLLVSDATGKRLTYLMPDGRVVRTVDVVSMAAALPPSASGRARSMSIVLDVEGRFRDGRYFATQHINNAFGPDVQTQVTRDSIVLHRLDPTGARSDTIGRVAGRLVYIYVFRDKSLTDLNLPFGASGNVAMLADGFQESAGERREIRERTSQGRLARITRVCGAPLPVTPADIATVRDSILGSLTGRLRTEYEEILSTLPFPRTKPGYTQLLVDAAGRIWAKDFASNPRGWHVFTPAGRLLGTVQMPAGATPVEIGRDFVLATYVDRDGVTSVRLYAMSESRP
jgi:hypothetical protein